jgi:lipopolysaccharide biosynthesis protein
VAKHASSICFFTSYYEEKNIPYYIQAYLSELRKHFTKLVFITVHDCSEADKKWLNEKGIDLFETSNEGYDFGAWYKAMKKHDTTGFSRVALVNDSCILFKPLDEFINWADTNSAELKGMTFSESLSKHIQSYFILLEGKAIQHALDYFETHKILPELQKVIHTYEVGMSAYLLSKGVSMDAFVSNNGYSGEHSPYYYCVTQHIEQGIPLIKKKIIFSSYRKDELLTLARMNFKLSPEYYIALIKRNAKNLIIDFAQLCRDRRKGMSELEKLKYRLMAVTIKYLRPVYKRVKND